ncbi:MAG TPA: FtsX-like permease family protein [Streptosporangiaceae bacterium]|nr:FtsX-like permease family protein [Streptosporangiaceae bacterium]
MIGLGLRLATNSGREALTRLIVTTVAVAVGVALLLAVLAEFHAFQADANRVCWECTQGDALPGTLPSRGEAWNYSVDYYQGQTIERLDLAAHGPGAPVPPGLSRLPGPGQYLASPALAHLIATVPRDELGDRFPGTMVGTIGDAALTGPAELVVYVGYAPSALARVPGTQWVTAIGNSKPPQVFTPYFRYAFGVGVLAVLFPVLILISTATRLAATRREERYAALRLVGATPRDVSVLASVDSVTSALLGAVVGIGVFLAIRPSLADAVLTGTRYFASTVTPTVWGYVALLVAVPLASAAASLLALGRVRISPLGVSRRTTPPRPSPWRLAPLIVGVILFVAGALATNHDSIGVESYPGLIIVMIGLVIAGPWLTTSLARWCSRTLGGSASGLLASRRLADDPRAAFRAVRGLVLAVFIGTIVGALVPLLDSLIATPNSAALSNVLLDTFFLIEPPTLPPAGISGITPAGLTPQAGATLVRGLQRLGGTTVYPLYTLPGAGPAYQGTYIGVVSCSALRQLAVLGQCAPGARAVQVQDNSLILSDNPHDSTAAFVSAANPPYTGALSSLPLQAVLVRVDSASTLERVRTYLAIHAPPQVSSGPGAAATPPRTFGEAVAIRSGRAEVMQRLVYFTVTLTILVAGCSLAVSIGGGLVDRKRPFTLLRVSGTPLGTLYRVVLLEAVLPLVGGAVAAGVLAYGMSVLAVLRVAPAGTPVPPLAGTYYATLGAGLVLALAVIAITLPLLGRMTTPASARFE